MRRLHVLPVIGLLAFTVSALADPKLEADLAARLQAVLPDAKVTQVKPAPIPGLYEVMLGATVLYMTQDGRFAIRGDIFDLKAKSNVTEKIRADARTAALAAEAPATIEFAPTGGSTDRTLYVFTDIDCGYCRKMHNEIGQLNAAGITVRYLAFPRTGLNSESFDKAVAVWCAADKQAALTAAKRGQMPAKASQCANPVAEQFELGQSMGVHGTPAVFTAKGQEIGGYIPAGEIIKMFELGEI